MNTKFIFAIAFMLIAQVVNAQTFGLKGGVNLATMTISSSGMDISPKSIIGAHIGPVVDFKLQERIHFNTGLLYSLKGFKVEDSGDDLTEKLNYLEIPLNIACKFPINDQSKFFIQAGPYLGYALDGKEKVGNESIDIEFGEGGMKRFDYGIGFGCGVEFGSIATSINYQLGLANLYDDSTSNTKLKNKVLQISVAYMFGSKK